MKENLKSLIENTEKEAEKIVFKEYTLKNKAQLGALTKFLTASEVNQDELKTLINFYRFDNNYTIEDELIYNEFKEKLLALAEKNNVKVPQELT